MSPTPPAAPPALRAWTVVLAGTGVNLALGILYAWSLIKGAIEEEFGWKGDQLNDPYALCCLVFSAAMILAGRCQDRFGPRLTATLGGVLVGAGFALASATADYGVWLLGFGVLAGTGIGFGYASATPPALKWFPPSRTGLVAGIVVAGFGLAPVYLAPVTQHLLGVHGVRTTMLVLGVAFTAIVCGLAQFLVNPPSARDAATAAPLAAVGSRPRDILRTRAFWVLWAVFFVGAGAGLMVISSVSGMAKKSMGSLSFVAVAVMAVGNAGGRVVAGLLSDRIGRRRTLLAVLLFQAALMAAAIPVTGAREGAPVLVVLVASLIGFNYGANLSLFPAFAKDLWGLQGFGLNYGVLFSAWGVGGLVLSRLGQTLTARSHGSYESSLVTACVLLLAAAALTLLIRSRPAAAPVKAGTGGAPTHPAAPAAPPSGAGRRVA